MNQELEPKKETTIDRPRGRGHDTQVAQEDIMIPRLKLLQALSPEVQEDPEKFRQGMIINSLTKEEFPKDGEGYSLFVPVIRTVNWVRFNARSDKDSNFDPNFELGAVIWRSDDPSDPRVVSQGRWSEDGAPPVATKFINYLSFFPGCEMPVVVSFAKTSFKAGKALSTFTELVHVADDMFRFRYRIRSKKEQNDAKQQYYVLEVAQAGRSSDEEFSEAEAVFNALHGKELKVDEERDEEVAPVEDKKPWDA